MFAITRTRTPLGELQAATNRLNQLFNDAFSGLTYPSEDSPLVGNWVPPMDVMENKDQVRIVAELPGVKAEDVKIVMENNVLTIRGEKQHVAEQNGEKVHRYERAYGVFERSFSVPTTVDADTISAQYENGVLTVSLPKIERAKPRQISVAVRSK
jgi:HSP20 family protein